MSGGQLHSEKSINLRFLNNLNNKITLKWKHVFKNRLEECRANSLPRDGGLQVPQTVKSVTITEGHFSFLRSTRLGTEDTGGKAGTNYWGPAVQKGVQGPAMLRMFLYLSSV
jgi:hypothetical protein